MISIAVLKPTVVSIHRVRSNDGDYQNWMTNLAVLAFILPLANIYSNFGISLQNERYYN